MIDSDLTRQVNSGAFAYCVTHPDGRQERLAHMYPVDDIHLVRRDGKVTYVHKDGTPY